MGARFFSSTRHPIALAAALVAANGCDSGDDTDAEQAETTGWDVERECVAPAGLGAPASIADAVALINALPMPVTLPCVLSALDRPLAVVAATSPFSAQPTESLESPRLFLVTETLVMSVVPTGDAQSMLEFAEYAEPGRSLKGELEFPVMAPLGASAPFESVLVGDATGCSLCHASERFAGAIDTVPTYTSEALAPEQDRLVSIGFVEQQARVCDRANDQTRCDLFAAIFAHGNVTAGAFRLDTRVCIAP